VSPLNPVQCPVRGDGLNDQRRGRLTLIRHLLDHIPDRKVPEILIEFPPLDQEPLRERFGTSLKPIAPAK